jgi:hypothetical protein
MTFRAAGSNLSIAVFHSSNDKSLFHTQGLYCMNRFFCLVTAILIVHVFKNTLENVHQSTISRVWRGLNQTGSSEERSISGRTHITTPAQDQYIRIFHLRNRYSH